MIKLSIIIPTYNNENRIERCLNSIELREDIELIIIDDCSVDDTYKITKRWIKNSNFKNITHIKNNKNIGVGLTMNKGYDLFKGEYVMTLCDDDYLIQPLSVIIDKLNGTDLVYYNLVINNGSVFKLTPTSKNIYVGATKVYKKTIIGNTRRLEKRVYGDADFYFDILKKHPTEKFTNINLYHYDFPRKGSLINIGMKK